MNKDKWKQRAVEVINITWGPDWGDDGLVEQVAIALESAYLEGWEWHAAITQDGIHREFDARDRVRKIEEAIHKLTFDGKIEDRTGIDVLLVIDKVLRPDEAI